MYKIATIVLQVAAIFQIKGEKTDETAEDAESNLQIDEDAADKAEDTDDDTAENRDDDATDVENDDATGDKTDKAEVSHKKKKKKSKKRTKRLVSFSSCVMSSSCTGTSMGHCLRCTVNDEYGLYGRC